MDSSDTQAGAQAEAYRKMTGTLIDFLFDVNSRLAADMTAIRADGGLTEDHRDFALFIEQTRREALANVCVMLSGLEAYTALPTSVTRHWLLEQMLVLDADGEPDYLWHGYRYVENMVLTFEREFEKKLAS